MVLGCWLPLLLLAKGSSLDPHHWHACEQMVFQALIDCLKFENDTHAEDMLVNHALTFNL